MVEYSEWVGIVFDVAKTQGYEASFEENNDVITVAAEIWNDNRTFLIGANEAQARRHAQSEVQVT